MTITAKESGKTFVPIELKKTHNLLNREMIWQNHWKSKSLF